VAGLPKRCVYILGRRIAGQHLLEAVEEAECRGLPEGVDRRTAGDQESGDVPASVADGVVQRRPDRPSWCVELGSATDERGRRF
jgi:hypothetical protein